MSTELIEALRREAERIEEDADYTHKGHYVAAERWGRRRYWLGIPAAVSAALASALIFFEGSAAATKLAQVLPQFDPTGSFVPTRGASKRPMRRGRQGTREPSKERERERNTHPPRNLDREIQLNLMCSSNKLPVTHPPRLPGSGWAAQPWRVFFARRAGGGRAVP